MQTLATFAMKVLRLHHRYFFKSCNSVFLQLSDHIIHSDPFTSSTELHLNPREPMQIQSKCITFSSHLICLYNHLISWSHNQDPLVPCHSGFCFKVISCVYKYFPFSWVITNSVVSKWRLIKRNKHVFL